MNVEARFFTGEFEHTIDSVNRLIIPSKWRTGESEELFLLVRDEGSLSVLTHAELVKITQGIDASPNLSNREKRDRKQIFSSAHPVTCDKQGRITMEAALLKKIGVKDTVIFVGGVQRFEIWSPKAWEQRKSELSTKRVSILEELGI